MPHPTKEQPMRAINETHLWKEERHANSGRVEHDVNVRLQCVTLNIDKKYKNICLPLIKLAQNDTMISH